LYNPFDEKVEGFVFIVDVYAVLGGGRVAEYVAADHGSESLEPEEKTRLGTFMVEDCGGQGLNSPHGPPACGATYLSADGITPSSPAGVGN
jgi:hypothetical protein